MTKDIPAQVSALMDDEIAHAPGERAVDALLADPALRRQWAHHHEISDVLADRHVSGAGALADRVAAALASEPVPIHTTPPVGGAAGQPPGERARMRPLFALAASLAAVAVVTTVLLGGTGSEAPAPPAVARAPVPETAPARPASAGVVAANHRRKRGQGVDISELTRLTWNDPRPKVERRLNGYLLNHNEYLATGVRGMLPYARVVGYEPGN